MINAVTITGLLETLVNHNDDSNQIVVATEKNGNISIIPRNGREIYVDQLKSSNKIVLSTEPIEIGTRGTLERIKTDIVDDIWTFDSDELADICEGGDNAEILLEIVNLIDMNRTEVFDEDNLLRVIKELKQVDSLENIFFALKQLNRQQLSVLFGAEREKISATEVYCFLMKEDKEYDNN